MSFLQSNKRSFTTTESRQDSVSQSNKFFTTPPHIEITCIFAAMKSKILFGIIGACFILAAPTVSQSCPHGPKIEKHVESSDHSFGEVFTLTNVNVNLETIMVAAAPAETVDFAVPTTEPSESSVYLVEMLKDPNWYSCGEVLKHQSTKHKLDVSRLCHKAKGSTNLITVSSERNC